jgi:hypothetical protein
MTSAASIDRRGAPLAEARAEGCLAASTLLAADPNPVTTHHEYSGPLAGFAGGLRTSDPAIGVRLAGATGADGNEPALTGMER